MSHLSSLSILVTGGLGFIGSHICVELLKNGNNIIILDNLSNSNINVLEMIKRISNTDSATATVNEIPFYNDNILNINSLNNIFSTHKIDCVIHCAALKSVSKSIKTPLDYYNNNVIGTLSLINTMNKHKCNNLIFSSSATVYGNQTYPITETSLTGIEITNPYGKTKYFIEEILKDICHAQPNFNAICLRYFNPIGAHPSGLLGENPNDIPNNLMPYLLQSSIAQGKIHELKIFGNDYNTPDGTCIRDFIHAMDLARGHILAMNSISNLKGFNAINLGSGKGTSVLELLYCFERVNNVKIKHLFTNRRPGDLPIIYANISKAKELIGFEPLYTLEHCCRDSYNFIIQLNK